jgi:hypothetical protein
MVGFTVLLGLSLAHGATLDSKDGKMMRHEREVKRVEFNPSGELVDSAAFKVVQADKTEAAPGYCDIDFIYGKINSDECDFRAHFNYSNLTEDECIYAAEKGGATTKHDSFEVGPSWQDAHPKGCFVYPCDNGWCYYANEIGDQPMGQHIGGVPVCRRDKYINGEAIPGKTATDPSICKDSEYEVVLSEKACILAASCLGDCAGDPFDIGIYNESKRLEFPAGCFIHQEDAIEPRQCVYWNNPNWTASFAPTEPKGTPICKVKVPDHVGQLNRADFATTAAAPAPTEEGESTE